MSTIGRLNGRSRPGNKSTAVVRLRNQRQLISDNETSCKLTAQRRDGKIEHCSRRVMIGVEIRHGHYLLKMIVLVIQFLWIKE